MQHNPVDDVPPSTRYLNESNDLRLSDADAYISSINWLNVTAYEPEKVASWISYLHRREARGPLISITKAVHKILIDSPTEQTPHWLAFAEGKLPRVVLDIVCEAGMFDLEETAFKVRFNTR